VSTPNPGATGDYSRGDRASRAVSALPDAVRFGLLAAAVAGAALLLAAEFSSIISVKVGVGGCPAGQPCPTSTGYKRHLFALGLVAIAALPLAWGAVAGASRPAMLALAGLGAVAMLLIVLRDVPHIHDTGVIGQRYEDARARAETGFYLETAGAVLLLLSGGALALLTGGRVRPGGERREPRGEAGPPRSRQRRRARHEDGPSASSAPSGPEPSP
jgi:hypothetical protein